MRLSILFGCFMITQALEWAPSPLMWVLIALVVFWSAVCDAIDMMVAGRLG